MNLLGKHAPKNGETPSIVLTNPKYGQNVGMVVRLASAFAIKQVWYTGSRINEDLEISGRLPREERMKQYQDVDLCGFSYPLERFKDATPVAVEVRENSENLHAFIHPPNPVYIFGPEDGGIDKALLVRCHRFVVIPSQHCLNLATAVATVLYDRQHKMWLAGEYEPTTPGEFEKRGHYGRVQGRAAGDRH